MYVNQEKNYFNYNLRFSFYKLCTFRIDYRRGCLPELSGVNETNQREKECVTGTAYLIAAEVKLAGGSHILNVCRFYSLTQPLKQNYEKRLKRFTCNFVIV